jgi:hypothetical protein
MDHLFIAKERLPWAETICPKDTPVGLNRQQLKDTHLLGRTGSMKGHNCWAE